MQILLMQIIRSQVEFARHQICEYKQKFFVCLICGFTSQSASMVMLRRSVNLTTLFLGRLPKRLTSTKCTSFRQ